MILVKKISLFVDIIWFFSLQIPTQKNCKLITSVVPLES